MTFSNKKSWWIFLCAVRQLAKVPRMSSNHKDRPLPSFDYKGRSFWVGPMRSLAIAMIASARPTAGWSQWPDCDCLEIQSHRPESEGSTLVVKRRQGTILVVRRHSGHIRKVAGIQFFYNAVILFESGLALPGTTEFNLLGRSSGARLYIYLLPDTITLLHNQLASPGAWDFT